MNFQATIKRANGTFRFIRFASRYDAGGVLRKQIAENVFPGEQIVRVVRTADTDEICKRIAARLEEEERQRKAGV